MSATQSAHHPLMCRYYREADHSRKEPPGDTVSATLGSTLRAQCVRSNSAEKTSRGMTRILDLCVQERLEFKAETIEHLETTWVSEPTVL